MNNTKVPSEGSNFSSTLRQLLDIMVQQGASDLHIAVGLPPCLRLDGKLSPIEDMPSLLPNESMGLCFSVLSKEQQQQFERDLEIDFSFGVRGLSRFRASLFQQRGAVSGTFRVIPFRIGTPDELGLPNIVADLAKKPRGLVLITGPTGSGKSTTLACIVNLINHNRHEHIITIEDPIEYLHQHRNCIVTQREIGTDTRTFSDAIRRILRQDPDVIQVGEMRDLASIEATLTLAETGHLVLATLHTSSAINTINRIVDVFPPYKQKQIQIQLSFALEAVICQQLLPRIGGGRVLALELFFPNAAIRNLIREDKLHQIYSQMQIGQTQHGMQTLNQSLCDLYTRNQISLDDALSRSTDILELRQMLNQLKRES